MKFLLLIVCLENYVKVIVESDNDISEQILKVKIKDVKNEFLEGILV